MKQTIADSLIEKGYQLGVSLGTRQMILIRQLTIRFGKVPAEIRSAIKNNRDSDKLDEWLDGVVTARSLRSIGIR